MDKKMAIIDLGSNSVRMIIMKIYENGSYKMIDQAKEPVRLSEGMGSDKTLKPLAIKRTINTLRLFKKIIDAHRVDQIFSIATAAVRSASNQEFFLEKVKLETGFDFTVITGEEEGYLDYLGVVNTVGHENFLIVDTGGASTELVMVKSKKIKSVISIPFGAVNLTEKFIVNEKGKNPSVDLKSVEKYIDKKLGEIDWLDKCKGYVIVGLGGSIRTLAKIDRKDNEFPLDSLHNYSMKYDRICAIYKKISETNIEERCQIPGISKERADIIVAGLAPLKLLMKKLSSKELVVSGNGLREGVFFKNYFSSLGHKDEVIDALKHSVENTLNNYDVNIKHSYHVEKLSLSMFDQLKNIHSLGNEERKLLSVSALLHDIGMYVDYYDHHKHGFYLVLNSKIYGLSNRELVMCAFIVAMHRLVEFKVDWRGFSALINKDDYEIIKKLAIITCIAEKLDRNEFGTVKDVICYTTEDSVQILVKADNKPELEILSAAKNDKVFEKIFGRKLYIV